MKMNDNYLNFEMTRGDTFSFGLEIYDIGQAVETAFLTCKKNFDDKKYIFRKSLNHGITLSRVEGDNYFYVVRIAPDDTKNLELEKYYYDLQIGINDDIYTILKGILTLEYDVTREGDN